MSGCSPVGGKGRTRHGARLMLTRLRGRVSTPPVTPPPSRARARSQTSARGSSLCQEIGESVVQVGWWQGPQWLARRAGAGVASMSRSGQSRRPGALPNPPPMCCSECGDVGQTAIHRSGHQVNSESIRPKMTRRPRACEPRYDSAWALRNTRTRFPIVDPGACSSGRCRRYFMRTLRLPPACPPSPERTGHPEVCSIVGAQG
jgi:hypothetical protein